MTRIATWFCRCLCAVLIVVAFTSTAYAQREVTLHLNTATLPDTLDVDDEIQVRGAVGGEAPFTLPSGEVIDWDDDTTVEATNEGGDYWTVSFQLPEETSMAYKFYSPLAESDGVGGWEDNPAGSDNHMIAAGTGDTTLVLHYFAKGADKAYDWRPYEEKEDTVAVWFRVYMATEAAKGKNFVAGDNSIDVVVRGGAPAPGAMEDWSTNIATLTRESDNPDAPGFFLYSGPIYYPETAADETQQYKFVFILDGVPQWEDSPNREFSVPTQDSTLHWVYYGDSKPTDDIPTSDPRVEALITFAVDVGPLEEAGLFQVARGDSIQVRGGFNGWDDSDVDDSRLRPTVLNPALWDNQIPVSDTIGGPQYYKFFLAQNDGFLEGDAGYEEPLDYGGGNRVFTFTGEDIDLGTGFYNNIREDNVIPEETSVEVTFQIDMTAATGFTEPFDPETDQVRITFEDGIWEGTQAEAKELDVTSDEIQYVSLSDADGDMMYTGTFTVEGPTYNGIGYGIEYGDGETWTRETGDRQGEPGRRRYQYILPNQDGSIPATYTFPVIPAQSTFPLPFECNPTADLETLPESVTSVCYDAGTSPEPTSIEPIDGEVPRTIALAQNYPNPFNPTTTFEYTLPATQHVTVRVYDLMGRGVATLVDGVQTASTYRVSFDASALASGVYIYQLRTPSQIITKQMILVK